VDDQIKKFHDDLKILRRDLKNETNPQVAKKGLRSQAEELGSRWFNDISPALSKLGFSAELVDKYSAGCARLIKLSAPNNLRTSYLEVLDALIRPMRDDLILPIKSGAVSPSTSPFNEFVSQLEGAEESAYFQESLDCAKSGYLRAAAVLGWCAAIDRIHRKIEEIGFPKFNVTSAQMASQQKGRYKRFNQTQNVSNISELREVFDTTILWVIEGMGLIDSNQHTRLRSCFDIRCHSAHPGEAPITEYNLMSFFSDLQQIVLATPAFEVTTASQ
jgi:hypothetical protein